MGTMRDGHTAYRPKVLFTIKMVKSEDIDDMFVAADIPMMVLGGRINA